MSPSLFGVDLIDKKIDAGCIATWVRQAHYDAQCDWVLTHTEHDRDRRGCGLCCDRSRSTARRCNHSHATLDKIGQHHRQALEMAFQPVILDHAAPALDS